MSATSNIFTILFVMIVGGAIVAIGAQELHQRYGSGRSHGQGVSSKLVKELHGDIDVERASLANRKNANRQESSSESSDQSALNDLLKRVIP